MEEWLLLLHAWQVALDITGKRCLGEAFVCKEAPPLGGIFES